VRFHHRLVAVHPFPNGNGRHGRIAADYLVSGLDRPRLDGGPTSTSAPTWMGGQPRRRHRRASGCLPPCPTASGQWRDRQPARLRTRLIPHASHHARPHHGRQVHLPTPPTGTRI
jgi:hypothetical protein